VARRHEALVEVLLDQYGETYAQKAGIRLADKPSPLYQLLVLATLLSARISGDVAVAAARELFDAGYRSPQAMRKASWQHRVDALGRGHYRRYDERTSTMLGEAAEQVIDRWRGDLRNLREEAGGDRKQVHTLLMDLKGIGPTGADIFLREVQAVWDTGPYLDARAVQGAKKVGLPASPSAIAELVDSQASMASVASALVQVSRGSRAAETVKQAAKSARR
jgi:endonuclease III